MNSRLVILTAALITEGLVVIVAYILWGLCDLELVWGPPWFGVAVGVLFTMPLLLLNGGLEAYTIRYPTSTYAHFSREVIIPLCKEVPPILALLLGCLSGFGEELLFRGVLSPLLIPFLGATTTLIVTSALFAWVHFIGQMRRYYPVLLLYCIVGGYFWLIYWNTQSLIAVMVCHGLYNFIVLCVTKRRYSGRRSAT